MRILTLIIITGIAACNSKSNVDAVNDTEVRLLKKLHENYRDFWLQNDSTKVVNLFSEDGAIIPPNNKGYFVKGKKAIGAWWFTATGDTTYPITSFIYKDDSLTASGDLATWEGVSEVGWETRVKDSVISTHTSASNFITVGKKENGEWKIYRQIWNVRPAK
jgi:ketosteroid isomerase-like protein